MNGEMIWDKFEDMREVMGDTNLLIALADSLGTDKLYGELLLHRPRERPRNFR